jgi:uncharacterized protein YukJ
MPLKDYGVLRATLVQRLQATDKTGHYQLLCDVGGANWRVAINARSALPPSDVAYAVLSPFAHPLLDRLDGLADGWQALDGGDEQARGLDYIRGNLAQPDQFRPLPLSQTGPDNDLNDLFDFHLLPLIGDADARVYAFGQSWGPEEAADKYFDFTPGRGVHDIHQNQGNVGRFTADDGVWQDGGLLTRGAAGWTAILLRFQSQAWHTDDRTGHALPAEPAPGVPGEPGEPVAGPLRIVAAAVNPPGPAPEDEHVLVLNAGYEPVDVSGWRIATDHGSVALGGTAPAAATLDVSMPPTAPLSNKGGRISLLDPAGLKAHGVAYSAAQAASEDRLIVF